MVSEDFTLREIISPSRLLIWTLVNPITYSLIGILTLNMRNVWSAREERFRAGSLHGEVRREERLQLQGEKY
jgi:hypothetical protein